ncbi:unnamed protein product, partial [Closterium sp. NIES-54]
SQPPSVAAPAFKKSRYKTTASQVSPLRWYNSLTSALSPSIITDSLMYVYVPIRLATIKWYKCYSLCF